LRQRCAGIRLLVVDVDGVLTDGGIIHGSTGLEVKQFHVRDGSALRLWQQTGRRTALITGRQSPLVEVRAAEVGIEFVFQGAAAKATVFAQLLVQFALSAEAACYVGDDVPDLPVLHRCGLAVAVADACAETRAAAHYITRAPGGRGAVREVIELILRCGGEWQEWVERLRRPDG
jgi:3-deoxy-D-manno-octulosonate 8-phosphate phosphatase (KDO 8-P phosphatase)